VENSHKNGVPGMRPRPSAFIRKLAADAGRRSQRLQRFLLAAPPGPAPAPAASPEPHWLDELVKGQEGSQDEAPPTI
jgi:hypothetical protein